MRWELSSRGRLKAERDSRLLAVLLKLLPSITAFTTLPSQTTIVTASNLRHHQPPPSPTSAITNLRHHQPPPSPTSAITNPTSFQAPPAFTRSAFRDRSSFGA